MIDGVPRSASVCALRDSKLSFISRADFDAYGQANPTVDPAASPYSPPVACATRGGDFSLSQECIMKIRWASFFLPPILSAGFYRVNSWTSEEAVLGQGNISCSSWIENRRDDNPLAATRTAWVLGFITAYNQYGAKPQRDVSGGKDTEVLMARIR